MSSITMPSGIIRGRATSCCSLDIGTSTASSPCNAASDWVAVAILSSRGRVSWPASPDCELVGGDKVGACWRRCVLTHKHTSATAALRIGRPDHPRR
jgi:hypothetical protein